MLNKVNLNLLTTLRVLLEECHVSRTAHRLHLTQSAVSRQLSQLRELFSDPLLVRDGNQLIITPRAIQLQKKLNSIFHEFDELLNPEAFVPQNWQGEFVIASSDYVAQYVFPEVVSNLATQAPNISIQYQLWQPSYLSQLADSPIQLASTMLPEQPQGVSSMQIGCDRSVCVMRKGHPLAQSLAQSITQYLQKKQKVQSKLSVDDLLAYSHIRVTGGGDKDSYLDKALQKIGKQRHIALKVPFFSAAFNVLGQSDYLMVLPFHIANNLSQHLDICFQPLPLDTPVHKYWLLWHPKHDQDLAHQWARNNIKQVMENSQYSIGYEA